MIFRLKLVGKGHGNSYSKSTEVRELAWVYMLVHYMVVSPLSSMPGKVNLSDVFHVY